MNNSDKILRGDLNARSDSEPDFIQNNSYGDYECDIIQEKRICHRLTILRNLS
jgi:hypothetical protein